MGIRTDLATESILTEDDTLPDGIKRNVKKSQNTEITEIIVETAEAGRLIGKPVGRYITIDTSNPSADFNALEFRFLRRQLVGFSDLNGFAYDNLLTF